MPTSSFADAVNDYLNDCRRRGLRPATLRYYTDALRHFSDHTTPVDLTDLDLRRARQFQDTISAHMASSSVRGYLRVLKTFATWCFQEDMLERDPLARLRLPRADQRTISVPSDSELARLIRLAPPSYAALIAVLAGTGLRISEACALDLIDLRGDRLQVQRTKGRVPRLVHLDPSPGHVLDTYVRMLRTVPRPDAGDPLFVSRAGRRLTASAARQALRRKGRRAAIEGINPTAGADGSPRSAGIRAKLWQAVQAGLDGSVAPRSDRPLEPLIAEYTAIFGSTWRPVTRRKHRDDFARFTGWLKANERPVTTASLDFATPVAYVEDLRGRPKVSGVWRGGPDALGRSLRAGPIQTLSANSVNAYVRPLRSLAIWLVDEGILAVNPFRRSRRRTAQNPLLPSEETPTKGATIADLRALEGGCTGDRPIDLRDQAIVAILVTTAARNTSVRLLRLDDIDLARAVIRFRRAKGGKTLDIALHDEVRTALLRYLERGRPGLLAGSARTRPVQPLEDPGWLFVAWGDRTGRPLSANATSLMLTRRYHAGGGTVRSFGSHRIRHATATLLVNNGMPLEEVSRYLGHSSTMPTRRYAQQSVESLGHRAAAALSAAGLVAG